MRLCRESKTYDAISQVMRRGTPKRTPAWAWSVLPFALVWQVFWHSMRQSVFTKIEIKSAESELNLQKPLSLRLYYDWIMGGTPVYELSE